MPRQHPLVPNLFVQQARFIRLLRSKLAKLVVNNIIILLYSNILILHAKKNPPGTRQDSPLAMGQVPRGALATADLIGTTSP
jgi:hypothetical protein